MADYEEMELGIDALHTDLSEEALKAAFKGLNGIHGVRLVRAGGAHIIYNPLGITPEEIRTVVRQAGFAIDTSQKTGEL